MRFLVSEKLGPHKYKTPEGYLVCVDAILSRTGTQEYRRRELFGDACDDPDEIVFVDRKAEEVFSDKTMASFENKPICIEHPDSTVKAENYNELSVGFVRDIHRGEDNGVPVMMGTLVITDKEAVEAVERGEYKELSCGYDCDITDEPSPQQRNIRGNHVALCKQGRAGIARIVDSVADDKDSLMNDAKLSAKERNEISSYLSSISKYTKNDPDVIDLILPLERKGYKLFRKNIKGWYKTSDGMMRKDYFFGIKGYDNTFMISMYADEGDWKVNEVNAYFVDSADIISNKEKEMKDEPLTHMSVKELMKYYTGKNTRWGANIFKINGKYTINPNISSRRYNTIAELEAGEEKYQAQIAKGYALNDPNQFGDAIDDAETFTVEYMKDGIMHIVEIEATSLEDAILKAKDEYKDAVKDAEIDRLIEKYTDDPETTATLLSGKRLIVELSERDERNTALINALKKAGFKQLSSFRFVKDSVKDSKEQLFTIEYAQDGVTYVRKVRANSIEDAISKVKDEYIADASQTQDLVYPSWTKFSNLYEHGNRDGVIERIESTGGKAKFGLPYNYLSYRTTVRMNKDGRRVTSYLHLRMKESDAKKMIGMEITGRQSSYTSIMEWYPKGASLRFANSMLRQNK